MILSIIPKLALNIIGCKNTAASQTFIRCNVYMFTRNIYYNMYKLQQTIFLIKYNDKHIFHGLKQDI